MINKEKLKFVSAYQDFDVINCNEFIFPNNKFFLALHYNLSH